MGDAASLLYRGAQECSRRVTLDKASSESLSGGNFHSETAGAFYETELKSSTCRFFIKITKEMAGETAEFN